MRSEDFIYFPQPLLPLGVPALPPFAHRCLLKNGEGVILPCGKERFFFA
jgi:hypothetical protein